MPEYQKRVIKERNDLVGKIIDLTRFFNSDKFDKLPQAERARIYKQLEIMDEYSRILNERIVNF
jgi:hypothetical protein